MSTLRLYAPMILLMLWAAVFLVCDDALVVAVAFLSVAWSVRVHVIEAGQRYGGPVR